MKNLCFALAVIVMAAFSFAFLVEKPIASYSLKDAINKDLIVVESTSLGGLGLDNFQLKITNKTNATIEIQVIPGTLFQANSDPLQNMLIVEPSLVSIKANRTETVLKRGYCTELKDACPFAGSPYSLNEASKDLQTLTDFIAKHPELYKSEGLIQSAVWSITDRESVCYLYAEGHSVVEEMRKLCCEITDQMDVWYHIERTIMVGRDHQIISEPLQIKGDLKLDNPKEVNVRCSLVNQEGEEIWAHPSEITLPPGKIETWFELTVKDWPKGDYTVFYKTKKETLLAQEFTLE